MPIDQRYQKVKCDDCGRDYQCLPSDDYYKRPGGELVESDGIITGGVCEKCLLKGEGITKPMISSTNN